MQLLRTGTRSTLVAVAIWCAGVASYAHAQQLHGIAIAKGCVSPLCEGETTNCDVQIGYNDGFGDTIRLLSAWDVQDFGGDNVRVPAVGDLPIVAVGGNTNCMVGGSLPCEIGPAGSTLNGLPGTDAPGFVRFQQNTYVIQPDDPDVLRDQATVEWMDLCDAPDTSGCGPDITNPAPAPASTLVTRCDDGNDCTTDSCSAGVCSFTPDCTVDADCNDGDACTMDVCTDDGCCESSPITCDDGNDCTTDTCDPASGCVFTPDCTVDTDCDDVDACTMDVCTDEGCCENNPITCDDDDACTEDTCDPATGCVFASISCDDGNVCTADSCDPATGCINTPECTSDADCNDDNACTMDACTDDGCCEQTPITCDDGDECTEDTCDPVTGCVFTPIDPPPPGCVEFAGCTPGFWKQKHHLMFWMGYMPDDLFEAVFGVDATVLDGKTLLEAAQTGGGHEAALGRHAVAALLNAASGEVEFAFTEAEVIAMVQEAYATGDFNRIKDLLEAENEQGCTVDKSQNVDGRAIRGNAGRTPKGSDNR